MNETVEGINNVLALPTNVLVGALYFFGTLTLGAIFITFKLTSRSMQHPTWTDLTKAIGLVGKEFKDALANERTENRRIHDEMANRYQRAMEDCSEQNHKNSEEFSGFLRGQSKELGVVATQLAKFKVGLKTLLPADKAHILDD